VTAANVSDHQEMERDTLRLLCSVLLKPATRVEICRLLSSDKFYAPLQRIIFEEIRALGAVDAKQLLQLLPTRITNRGFPDFDLRELLEPKLVSEEQIEKIFQSSLRLMDVESLNE
jgi:hypothetical protein